MDASPTVRHRRLAAELRRLRERADLSQVEAAALAGFSRPNLIRIEKAQKLTSVSEVESVLDAYGVQDQLRFALVQLARDILKRGWWTAYGDVLSDSFAELEDAAKRIRMWMLETVPGLLQTADYARALIRSGIDDPAEIERRLEARQHRQAVLSRENAPTLDVLLHEMALRAPVGGNDVIRGQLAALRTSSRHPNVSVRVLPMSAGVRPGLGEGSFTIFDFPAPIDPGVIHLDSVAGSLYVEDVRQVTRCVEMYEQIADACLSETESAELMSALIEE